MEDIGSLPFAVNYLTSDTNATLSKLRGGAILVLSLLRLTDLAIRLLRPAPSRTYAPSTSLFRIPTAFPMHAMPATFSAKVHQHLTENSLTIQTLATHIGLVEYELHALYKLGDPRLSEVAKLSQVIQVKPIYSLKSSFLQAGIGNTQKIKIGEAAAHKLAEQLGMCRQH